MNYEDCLKRFKVVRRNDNLALCICPAHNDKKASLSVSRGEKGILFRCHAGCTLDSILNAVSLSASDIFYDNENRKSGWKAYVEAREKRKIEAVYNYVSCSDGSYAFTKLRLQGKRIIYGMLQNDRFTYGLPRNRPRKSMRAIYGSLEALNKAIKNGDSIFIPEGEKDVITLESNGYTAFTYGGCSDWQRDFAGLVRGANLIILADNDQAGQKVAEQILSDVQGVAKCAKIITPTPDIPKGDISDYFKLHNKEEFELMLKSVMEKRCDKPDLLQFHIVAENGKVTGVYHNAIFEYVKANYNILICGGTPYIYTSGYYQADLSGAKLKSIIRSLILPQFIKSTTINNIYGLFLQDISLEISFDGFNQYPSHWICFKNGMYDTKTKELLPHKPQYLAINQVPHSFIPNAKHEGNKIENFLDFICNQEEREMLLQFMGYSLTKDVGQQKFLVLNGEGGSGKSTVIRLIESLVGSNNVSNIALSDLQQRFASFGLMGKLLNSCADLEVTALEDTSVLKKVLGEDTLRAEQKGKDAVSFKSYAKLIFSTNELPLVRAEKTNGFYRRLLVLPMNKVPEHKNPNLFQELNAEIDYLLHLVVEAVGRMYSNETIMISESSEKAVLQLRCDSDTTEAFIQESCERDDQGKIERAELYSKYEQFCKDTDRQNLTRNNFYKSLRLKGFYEIKTNGIRYFKGISFEKKSLNKPSKSALDGFMSTSSMDSSELPFN